MSELAFRTSICSVVFVDIVDYSKAAVDRQVTMKDMLNGSIRAGVSGVPDEELIVLDAGDGAAICFFGDPEDALFAATAIAGELRGRLRLRTGINLGPVKIVTDLNGNRNVIGDAINVAQRIMSFASEHEILISRPYFEVVSCLRDENTFRFHPLGTRKDKHIREHEIYAVASAGEQDEQPLLLDAPVVSVEPPAPAIPDGDTSLPAEFVELCRVKLAQALGPLAGVLVKRAAAATTTKAAFIAFLADKIDARPDREAFLKAVGRVEGVPQPPQAAPAVPESGSSGAEGGEADATPIDDALVGKATAKLATFIGPMAKPLAARAASRATNAPAFIAMLAEHIDDEASRRQFLYSLGV